MQSNDAVPSSSAKESVSLFFQSVATGLRAMAVLAVLGAWQAYSACESFFELRPSEMGSWKNELWFCAGPISFFLASFLGLLFGTVSATAKHPATKKAWSVLLWLPLLWLVFGCVAFTALDYLGNGFNSSIIERLWRSLSLALPMAAAAACLWNIAMLVRRTSPSPASTPAARWKKIMLAAARGIAWIGAAIGSILAVSFSALLLLMASCTPPSLETLAARFPSQRHDLETLIQMSDQDADFSVIDPAWLMSSAGMVTDSGTPPIKVLQSPQPDIGVNPKSHMSIERWNEYRRILKRNHITQGIRRSKPSGDAFIIVKSEGMLDNGVSAGYLYCGYGPGHSYPPCSSKELRFKQPYTNNQQAYSFLKLADRWYAYSEGPG